MSESSWNESLPPKPRAIAPWIWFAGGGCLLVLVLGGLAIRAGFQVVSDWQEPAVQLPALRAALPFDELPEETRFQVAIRFPLDCFLFRDGRGFALAFYVAPQSQADDLRRTFLSPRFEGFDGGRREDAGEAEVDVQGRVLRGLRFTQVGGAGGTEGPSLALDVSPDGAAGAVCVQITRLAGTEPISDEEARLLLQPFHVGNER